MQTQGSHTICSLSPPQRPLCIVGKLLCCGEAGEKEKGSARGTMGRGKRRRFPLPIVPRALSIFVDYWYFDGDTQREPLRRREICSCNRLLFFKITNRLCGGPHTHRIKKPKTKNKKQTKHNKTKEKKRKRRKKSGYEKLAWQGFEPGPSELAKIENHWTTFETWIKELGIVGFHMTSG